MSLGDLKLYSLNIGALFVSMSTVDDVLKMVLLLVTIGYTLSKWYFLKKNKKK